MIQTPTRQLELNLWSDLKAAINEPQAADLQKLFQDLSRVVAEVQSDQRLLLAGEAIAQIVEVYVLRANLILDSLEVRDTSVGPILTEDFLSDLMRQSMTVDISDLMEDMFEKRRESLKQETDESYHTELQDKKKAKAIASEAGHDAKRMVLELAGQEDVPAWSEAIAQWLAARSSSEAVSLLHLQQELGMPLVEVWLGMLLGGQDQYMVHHGDFYAYPDAIFVVSRRSQLTDNQPF